MRCVCKVRSQPLCCAQSRILSRTPVTDRSEPPDPEAALERNQRSPVPWKATTASVRCRGSVLGVGRTGHRRDRRDAIAEAQPSSEVMPPPFEMPVA